MIGKNHLYFITFTRGSPVSKQLISSLSAVLGLMQGNSSNGRRGTEYLEACLIQHLLGGSAHVSKQPSKEAGF